MTVTYPVTPPAALLASSVRFTPRTIVGFTRSPFSGVEQIYVHQGQWWEMEIDVLPQARASMEDIIAWGLSLNGPQGTFTFSPPGGATPLGSVPGSPIVGIENQSGDILVTAGWTASQDSILKPGDWLSIPSGGTTQPRLHKNLVNAGSDGSGVSSLTLWPTIRLTAPVSGAAVTTSNALGIWRLTAGNFAWDLREASIYGMTIACVEALNP